ncbi:hypothetical protein FEM03_18240 [Phragmitibacter flavus]|uniref:Uncharacterized protein n=1 Tax=Phragmitibacter flavus TaxID=2576071 RepID=A0A5R8KAG3_9BACT|nr:hypothetical protein [Phragmitibacter flavus]TLD69312.1 hypothetical protein FEM03_18240 [Phragmitibacter flavus]
MNDELEEEKLRAETRLIDAQTEKLKKEVAPRDTLTRLGSGILEFVKITGALVLGFGGIATAITGYQLTEAKKERLDAEILKKQVDLDKVSQTLVARETEQKQNAEAIQQTLVALKSQIQQAPEGPDAIRKIDALQLKIEGAQKDWLSKKPEYDKAISRIEAPLK